MKTIVFTACVLAASVASAGNCQQFFQGQGQQRVQQVIQYVQQQQVQFVPVQQQQQVQFVPVQQQQQVQRPQIIILQQRSNRSRGGGGLFGNLFGGGGNAGALGVVRDIAITRAIFR